MTASVGFTLGAESVTVLLDIQTDDETILTGDIGGLVDTGTVARLRGNCRLTADLHVRGTLLSDPTGVDLDGQNLFDIHTHDGTLNLVGVEKTAWARWGDVVAGWQIGDRLAVAPTAPNVYVPTEITWQGSWTATARPGNSPDVTLVDGSIARPEVANLSQTVTLRNLKRIMIHEATASNSQTMKWIRVLNCGETGVLTMYPIHFHLIGDYARGSLLDGVVVEGGKNHAFVPHGSHGITFRDCVAYNTTNFAYWWDRTADVLANNSDDIRYEHCLALKVNQETGHIRNRLAGFHLEHGFDNACVDSVAVGVAIADSTSGFHWPEGADADWIFTDCIAHNNRTDGIFTWQNSPNPNHVVGPYISYRNGRYGVEHGAYTNRYRYTDLVLNEPLSFGLHSLGQFQVIENITAAGDLVILKHNVANTTLGATIRNCQFARVVYKETSNSGTNASRIVYEDCGLTPADFDLTGIVAGSIIEVREAGVLTHRWAGGWT